MAKSKTTDKIIEVALPRRIESNNSLEVQKEIERVASDNGGKKLRLNAMGTEYISSAGLRVLLTLQRDEIIEEICNVSDYVYGILDVTGFLDILKVRRHQNEEDTDQENLIGKDAYGELYKKDDENVIRVYKSLNSEEIEAGRKYSQLAMKSDISVAIYCGKASTAQGTGLVYAADGSESLANHIRKNPRELDEILKGFVEQIELFHKNEELKKNVKKITDYYRERMDANTKLSTDVKRVAGEVFTMLSRSNAVIFENVNSETVLYENGKPLFVDLSLLKYGNPVFELAGMYRNRIEFGKFLGESENKGQRTWQRLLELYFPDCTAEEVSQFDTVARSLGRLFSILCYNGTRKADTSKIIKQIQEDFVDNETSFKAIITKLKDIQGKSSDSTVGQLQIDIKERTTKHLFGKKTLLKDIRMEINPGEMVLLLGGSGAGKTTFLNAVTGYEKADAVIKSGDLDIYKDYSSLKHKIAFAPQQDILRDEDTVYNTIRNAAEMRLPVSASKEEKDNATERMLDIFGLRDMRNNVIRTLSGGQRKRASIAVEFVSDPLFFFLDEPDSGLDGVMARSLMEDLRKLTGEDKIIIVISHTPDRAIELFDKVIILAKSEQDGAGHLAFYGSPGEAREFFCCKTMEQVLKQVNRKSEGGEGRADEFIRKYSHWR